MVWFESKQTFSPNIIWFFFVWGNKTVIENNQKGFQIDAFLEITGRNCFLPTVGVEITQKGAKLTLGKNYSSPLLSVFRGKTKTELEKPACEQKKTSFDFELENNIATQDTDFPVDIKLSNQTSSDSHTSELIF